MRAQLQDAGNTVTLAHYLELLSGAGMVTGLSKFSRGRVRQRGSSPKLQVFNTALLSAQRPESFEETRHDGETWGHLVAACIGAHLLNATLGSNLELFYWRERNHEVDFVLQRGKTFAAIEVKTSRRRESLSGMEAFGHQFKPKRKLLVGGQGISVAEFLSRPVEDWLS